MRLNYCKIAQGDNQMASNEAIAGANIAAKQAEGDANRATTVATTIRLKTEAILLIRLMSV